MNAYKVVKQFEREICKYTGARYAVVVNSCTMAILLACAWHKVKKVIIPKRTYVSVPMSIIHVGGSVEFENLKWIGKYQLKPYPVWDCARTFTSGMYQKGQMMCISLHWSKILSIGQGGIILHDNPKANKWLRRARFDGRTEGVVPKKDKFDFIGWHCYMSPKDAAEGLSRLAVLPKHNKPLPNDDYPDLSKLKIFNAKT